MKRNRKVQILSAVVSLNGAIALSFISLPPAFASTCGPVSECIGYASCGRLTQAERVSGCQSAAPSCTVTTAVCLPVPFCEPNGGLLCEYSS
jgi:hypothetical protein